VRKQKKENTPGGQVPLLHRALPSAVLRAAHGVHPAVIVRGQEGHTAEKQRTALVAFLSPL